MVSPDSESPSGEESGAWVYDFHRGMQDELSRWEKGDHCLTIVSTCGVRAYASTLYQPARESARFGYSNAHCELEVLGQDVISDVTGTWCTSQFTPQARHDFIELASSHRERDPALGVELLDQAPSFGNCAERLQILRAMWKDDATRLKALAWDAHWHLNDAAHLEHRSQPLWMPDRSSLRADVGHQRVWRSIDLFDPSRNARDWGNPYE